MHSLKASILFISIAVFAFLADHQAIQNATAPLQGEAASVEVLAGDAAPVPPGPSTADKKKFTKVTRVVMATAYNAVPDQTDDTPEICAWGDRVRPGIIAISRDLERIGLTRGKQVHIEGIGNVVVMDRMHHRKKNQIDLYMERYQDAVEFGVQKLTISWSEDAYTEQES